MDRDFFFIKFMSLKAVTLLWWQLHYMKLKLYNMKLQGFLPSIRPKCGTADDSDEISDPTLSSLTNAIGKEMKSSLVRQNCKRLDLWGLVGLQNGCLSDYVLKL